MNETLKLEPVSKIPTGIEGFDHLTLGGLPQGRTTLLVGSSGSGKSLLSVEFLFRGATVFGRNGVFVTFEESPNDIVRNVKRLGWNLDQLEAQGKLAFVDASPEPVAVMEVGRYDLEGLFVQIKEAIRKVDAKILVMDSIGSLFSQFSDIATIRREIFRITHMLREAGVTALMTAERLAEYGQISRHGIEEFVSDNVVILRNVLEQERVRRTIQVLKVRGDSHMKGEFPFTISSSGISILPLSAMELTQESSNRRVGTGNQTLDEMTGGGIFQDSILLISGPTGGGKTLMSTMFTAEGCRMGERVLLLAYEESKEQLLRNAQSWGVNYQELVDQGQLKIICQYPETMGLEEHLLKIRRLIEEFKPGRLVMDSISAMERVSNLRSFREFVIGLTSFVKQQRCCALLTSTTPQLSGGESVTEAHISTITDVIMLLRYVEINCQLRRGIAVIKMRGSQHEKEIREFTIDRAGLSIGRPFKNVQNIILGIPSSSGPDESDQLGEMFGSSPSGKDLP